MNQRGENSEGLIITSVIQFRMIRVYTRSAFLLLLPFLPVTFTLFHPRALAIFPSQQISHYVAIITMRNGCSASESSSMPLTMCAVPISTSLRIILSLVPQMVEIYIY